MNIAPDQTVNNVDLYESGAFYFTIGMFAGPCADLNAPCSGSEVYELVLTSVTPIPPGPPPSPLAVVLPSPITVEATSFSGATVTFLANATSALSKTASCSPASGATFPLGANTVTCTATVSLGTTTRHL